LLRDEPLLRNGTHPSRSTHGGSLCKRQPRESREKFASCPLRTTESGMVSIVNTITGFNILRRGQTVSFKITGLDDLQREMNLLANVAEALDGEITTLKFDPSNQTSVERAIADMKLAIDQRVSGFRRSAMVDDLVSDLKQKYEQEILSRATGARMNDEGEVNEQGAD
jgi:hypothetical protein